MKNAISRLWRASEILRSEIGNLMPGASYGGYAPESWRLSRTCNAVHPMLKGNIKKLNITRDIFLADR